MLHFVRFSEWRRMALEFSAKKQDCPGPGTGIPCFFCVWNGNFFIGCCVGDMRIKSCSWSPRVDVRVRSLLPFRWVRAPEREEQFFFSWLIYYLCAVQVVLVFRFYILWLAYDLQYSAVGKNVNNKAKKTCTIDCTVRYSSPLVGCVPLALTVLGFALSCDFNNVSRQSNREVAIFIVKHWRQSGEDHF